MKRWLRPLGLIVSALALLYFLRYAYNTLSGHDLRSLAQPRVVTAGLVLTACYCLLIPVTAWAWTLMGRNMGTRLRFGIAAPVLATTQLGKYLPGNIAQHIGRLALARKHGATTPDNVIALAYETLLVVLASVHLATLTVLWAPPPALSSLGWLQHRGALLAATTVGALLALFLLPRLAARLARYRSVDPAWIPSRFPTWSTILACYLLYCTNFILVGFGLWLVAGSLQTGGGTLWQLPLMIGAFSGSWILGFMAPGAPAGLGVREALLSLWLDSTFGAPATLTLIVMLRIATTAGDLISFAWGSLALSRIGSTD